MGFVSLWPRDESKKQLHLTMKYLESFPLRQIKVYLCGKIFVQLPL